MRRILASFALLFLLPACIPAASAQAAAPVGTHIMDDGTGDVKVTAQGQGSAAPAGAFAAADLKALDVVEAPDSFVFTLTVASLSSRSDGPAVGNAQYSADFLQHDRLYRVRVTRQDMATTAYSAQLQGFDAGRGRYFTLLPLDVVANTAAGNLTVTVPRQSLVDENGAAPNPEIPITGFHASSSALFTFGRGGGPMGVPLGSPVRASDLMPDTGNSSVALQVRFGVAQSGHASLSSLIPTRASNGEATTFVFQVTAANTGGKDDTFSLAHTALPSGWTVQLPASQVPIAANASTVLPILVTTPFTHTHGSFQTFNVELRSLSDAGSVGRIQLGVRYTQPPQPAGHHSQLWFHSTSNVDDQASQALTTAFGGAADAYMNAAETDPNDAAVDVPADNAGTQPAGSPPTPTQTYTWSVPLSPALEMGLDFNVALKGALSANVKTAAPIRGAVLSGYLAHYDAPVPGQRGPGGGPGGQGGGNPQGNLTVLADLTPTAAVDIDAQGVQAIPAEVVPRPAADFVAFQQGASLALVLNVTFTRAEPFGSAAAPSLAPGSSLTLPLLEYHDPVKDVFLSNVTLDVTSPQDRFASPGHTVLFNLTLQNHGAKESEFLLQLTGTNVDWAALVPGAGSVAVPAGGTYNFSVVVRVPADVQVPTSDAVEKPAADLVIAATNKGDFNQHGLARLYTTVDLAPHPDDDAYAQALAADAGAKGTPGMGAPLVGVALAGLAALAMRRRAA